MEATQKKGFLRGGLAKSFSRFTKPRPTSGSGSGSKVVPCSTQSTSSYSSIPRVSTYSKQPTSTSHEHKNLAHLASSMQMVSYASAIEAWGHADENVDSKASSYISNVRQRFQLDRV